LIAVRSTWLDATSVKVREAGRIPAAHRPKLQSTNSIERSNGEIKRRTDVVGIFPNQAAVARLVGAILLEQSDEWAIRVAASSIPAQARHFPPRRQRIPRAMAAARTPRPGTRASAPSAAPDAVYSASVTPVTRSTSAKRARSARA